MCFIDGQGQMVSARTILYYGCIHGMEDKPKAMFGLVEYDGMKSYSIV